MTIVISFHEIFKFPWLVKKCAMGMMQTVTVITFVWILDYF